MGNTIWTKSGFNKGFIVWIVALAASGMSHAADLYVSPAGAYNGAGTLQNPVSLLGAANRVLAPGTNVYLLDGTYNVTAGSIPTLTNKWSGTSSQRISMMPAPGARPVINGRLNISGAAYVTLRDFEMTRTSDTVLSCADPDGRVFVDNATWWTTPGPQRPRYPTFAIDGALIEATTSTSLQMINLYLHDNVSGGAVSTWNPSRDTFTYGNLMIRNGWDDAGRGHGHGAYIQNNYPEATMGTSTKVFRHNITAYNHATGMKSYGESPSVRHTYFEGNIFYANGLGAWTNGSANFLAGTISRPLGNIRVVDNFFYQPDSVTGDIDGTVYMGWGSNNKEDAIFTGNRVYGGGGEAMRAQNWQNFTVTDNVFYDDKVLFAVVDSNNRLSTWTWDNNTYYDNGVTKPISTPSGMMTYTQWKATYGKDANSTWISHKPHGVEAFITLNEYDPHKAFLAVYNWDHLNTLSLEMSQFLKPGNSYVIWNVLDFLGVPAGSGTYYGGPVTVNAMSDPYIGNEFQSYLVQIVPEPAALAMWIMTAVILMKRQR